MKTFVEGLAIIELLLVLAIIFLLVALVLIALDHSRRGLQLQSEISSQDLVRYEIARFDVPDSDTLTIKKLDLLP